MTFHLLCAWYAIGDFAAPKITAQESAAFLMLAACILVFRTFRERHLLVWILGWSAYAACGWFAGDSTAFIASPQLQAVAHASFILAVSLFAAGILVYTRTQKYILPLFIATGTITTLAVARLFYWPDEPTLRVLLEIAYRVIAIGAAVQLIRYRWDGLKSGLGCSVRVCCFCTWIGRVLPAKFRTVFSCRPISCSDWACCFWYLTIRGYIRASWAWSSR